MPLSTSTHLQINPTTVVKFFPKFQKENKTFSLDDFCLQVGQSSLLLPPSQINMEIMSECGREQLGHELEELDLGEGKVSNTHAGVLLLLLNGGHFSITSADRMGAFVPAGAVAGE